jgi:purine-binding chemotaxis protein CheW
MSNIQTENIPANGAPQKNFQIVVFKIGEEEYGLHIDQIKEVVITPFITKMPESPAYIKGVANIRGNVIAILDLNKKFGFEEVKLNEGKSFTLVIDNDDYKMGIIVKEVPNTLSISSSNVESTGFVWDNNGEQSYIKGIVKLEKRLIIMIDILKVIQEKELQTLFSSAPTIS